MTKQDIEHAVYEMWDVKPHDLLTVPNSIDFALDMVRQHNEELALSWERQHGYDKFHVAKFIREAKP